MIWQYHDVQNIAYVQQWMEVIKCAEYAPQVQFGLQVPVL